MARMDAMTCRSSRTCPSCEHADKLGGCNLEAALVQALEPRPTQARRALVHLWMDPDARRPLVLQATAEA